MMRRSAAVMGITAIAVLACGCKPVSTASSDPASADFAARCSAALTIYYVDGGRGPAYVEKTKRARYWTQRLNKLMANTDDRYAMEKWKRVHRALHDEIHGKSIARKNEAMKQIMDACAPHEV